MSYTRQSVEFENVTPDRLPETFNSLENSYESLKAAVQLCLQAGTPFTTYQTAVETHRQAFGAFLEAAFESDDNLTDQQAIGFNVFSYFTRHRVSFFDLQRRNADFFPIESREDFLRKGLIPYEQFDTQGENSQRVIGNAFNVWLDEDSRILFARKGRPVRQGGLFPATMKPRGLALIGLVLGMGIVEFRHTK